ncbi:uncharacterized protein LOC120117773 [Hibiscus syriacus]|uniref:uncharacterized protein LOC120117773 n=1 Tax=Hibiscus syriacus TaxID=106335 RepID=UPI00192060CE|nr:uncharacterized protein LOC120117773 [Hibiscus syriacus]
MNVLSRLLNVAARNSLIRFHPKCKRVSLTHLCFADDLLIFCHGDVSSILVVVGVLGVFYELSSLQLNAGKSELFACGVHDDILSRAQVVTGFKLGSFPVRYLGVPLVTRKLTAKDYLPLVDNIRVFQISGVGSWFFLMWSSSRLSSFVKEYALKGTAFWEVSPKPQFSWTLRKLLKLRNTVADLFGNVVDWNAVKSKWVWEKLRDKREKVRWEHLIWFPLHVPRMSIVAWMVVLNRLPTKVKLINMGMKLDGLCDLCNAELEDKDHLFNDYGFVSGIWRSILQTCKIPHMILCWSDSLDWAVVNFRGKSLLVSILKLAWISLLYFVWEERNFRCFRGCSRSADNIFECIRRYVGDRINGCSINKADSVNLQLCLDWNIG